MAFWSNNDVKAWRSSFRVAMFIFLYRFKVLQFHEIHSVDFHLFSLAHVAVILVLPVGMRIRVLH